MVQLRGVRQIHKKVYTGLFKRMAICGVHITDDKRNSDPRTLNLAPLWKDVTCKNCTRLKS